MLLYHQYYNHMTVTQIINAISNIIIIDTTTMAIATQFTNINIIIIVNNRLTNITFTKLTSTTASIIIIALSITTNIGPPPISLLS